MKKKLRIPEWEFSSNERIYAQKTTGKDVKKRALTCEHVCYKDNCGQTEEKL